MSSPRVSVVMPSYNHVRYIADSIASVLAQTFTDWELVIVDDGSDDGSGAVAGEFRDSRITLVRLGRNGGGAAALNEGIRRAAGQFVAICNSDDVWEANRLERQLAAMEELPACLAVFSDVTWIDRDGAALAEAGLAYDGAVFRQPNRSRHAWIRRLVEYGNCLCHPSALVRRSVYAELGPYNNLLRQLPDMEMWLRVLQAGDIHVLQDRLVRFRMHGGNTSTPSLEATMRTGREHRLIVDGLLDEIGDAEFRSVFGGLWTGGSMPQDVETAKIHCLLRLETPLEGQFRELAIDRAYRLHRQTGTMALGEHAFQGLTGGPFPAPPHTGAALLAPAAHTNAPRHGLVHWLRSISSRR